jgi:uncharacterized protein (DUF302 family)
MPDLGPKRVLRCGFDEALSRVPDALRSEGFGVLTEIDVAETLRKKLGVDFRRYRILGACNPPLAHRALSANLDVGLMLPCNLIVYEGDDGRAVVAAVDPLRSVAAQELPAVREVATAVAEKLNRVLAQLDKD